MEPARVGTLQGDRDVSAAHPVTKLLLTITEAGMLAYWVFAALDTAKIISVPPEWMYSDHRNPMVVAWNWSFLPLDVLFAVLGLAARYCRMTPTRREVISVVSLSLMFCAGLMAVAFWTIQQAFDPFWWGVNLWLMILPLCVVGRKLTA